MRTTLWVFLATLLLTHMTGLADADQLRPLINDVQSADTETALKAIKGLGGSSDIRAVPPLLAALRDERGVVRQYAVEALQHLVRTLDKAYLVDQTLAAIAHQSAAVRPCRRCGHHSPAAS